MLPTILAGVFVAAILGLVIALMVREKRRGRPVTGCSGCGGSCSSCAMSGMCEAHINDVIRKNFEVRKVSSSHSKGRTEILSEEPIPEEALHQAIDPTGYRLTAVSSEPFEKKRRLFGKTK